MRENERDRDKIKESACFISRMLSISSPITVTADSVHFETCVFIKFSLKSFFTPFHVSLVTHYHPSCYTQCCSAHLPHQDSCEWIGVLSRNSKGASSVLCRLYFLLCLYSLISLCYSKALFGS